MAPHDVLEKAVPAIASSVAAHVTTFLAGATASTFPGAVVASQVRVRAMLLRQIEIVRRSFGAGVMLLLCPEESEVLSSPLFSRIEQAFSARFPEALAVARDALVEADRQRTIADTGHRT